MAKRKNIIDIQIGEVYRMIRDAENDAIEVVLVENGKETNNAYPVWSSYEPDSKSPAEWVRGIYLHNELNGCQVDVSFTTRQGKGILGLFGK